MVKQLWKLYRLLKQCPHWYDNAEGRWMTFPPTILWDCGSPEILGYVEMKLQKEFTRESPVHQFVGPEPALGMSRQNIKKMVKCWLVNQHMTLWQDLYSTHTKAQELISGHNPTVKTRILSFNKMHTWVIPGLVTGHNTMRRPLNNGADWQSRVLVWGSGYLNLCFSWTMRMSKG